MLKKFGLIGVALFAVMAFSAMAASSAFAEDIEALCLKTTPIPSGALTYETLAECEKMPAVHKEGTWWLMYDWLVGNVEITEALKVETKGLVTLIHLKGGFLEPETKIHCEGVFDGTIEPGGLGLVTELLEAGGHAVSLTNELSCTSVAGLCEEGTIFVVAENLPWLTSLEQMDIAGEPELDLALLLFSNGGGGGNPAYEILCTAVGSHHESLCEGETSVDLQLDIGPPVELLGIFNAEELELEGLEGLCEEGGSNHNSVALQEGEGATKLVGSSEEVDIS